MKNKSPHMVALLLLAAASAQAQGSSSLLGQTPPPANMTMSVEDSTRLLSTVTLLDVPAGHWAQEAVKTMVSTGLITGYPDSTFRGNQPLTRYQAALILSRIINSDLSKLSAGQREVLQKGVSSVLEDIQVMRGQLVTLGDAVTQQQQDLLSLRGERSDDAKKIALLESQVAGLTQQVATLSAGLKEAQVAAATAALGTASPASAPSAPQAAPAVASQPDVRFTAQPDVPANLSNPKLSVGVSAAYEGTGIRPTLSLDYVPVEGGPLTLQPYFSLGLGEVKATSLGLNTLYHFGKSGSDFRPYALVGVGGLVSEAWQSGGTATDLYGRAGFGVEYRMANTMSLFADVNGNYYFTNKGVGTGLNQGALGSFGFGARLGVKLRF